MIVYSARARLVALALKNHGDGDFIARGACMVVEYPRYDQRYNCHNLRDGGRRPLATMFTTPRRDFCLPYLYSTPPLGRFPSEYRHPVWYGKTRMVWLPEGEKISKISLFVLTPLTNVTDTQTDRHTHKHTQTLHDGIGRAYASHRAAKSKLFEWKFQTK